MENNEKSFYDKVKDWDFSKIKYIEENLTNWDMYEILKENTNLESKILDLGTGGGENLLANFPEAAEIIGTDFSEEMIDTANKNLLKSGRENIIFMQMDNLNMQTPEEYFDVVVARHTCIDAKQIYHSLCEGGLLILRGVDKLDCWELKKLFGRGQAYQDDKPISMIDYENILNAGFKNVELVPIYIREYYKTKDDFMALLYKTPILADFSEISNNSNSGEEEIDSNLINQYIEENTTNEGILLIRRYYGIVAQKTKEKARRKIFGKDLVSNSHKKVLEEKKEKEEKMDNKKQESNKELVNLTINGVDVNHISEDDDIKHLEKRNYLKNGKIMLSTFESRKTKFYTDEYNKNCDVLVNFLKQKIWQQDLCEIAGSILANEIYENLSGWLLKFYKNELYEGFKMIDYSETDFARHILTGFIISIAREKTNVEILYKLLVDSLIVKDVNEYADGRFEIITQNFGTINFYKIDRVFRKDKGALEYIKEYGDRIVDSCHEISYYLIKRYNEFYAITGIAEKDLNHKFYHSVVLDDNGWIIDVANNIAMPQEDYYMLMNFKELNKVSYEQACSENALTKKYDESGSLYDLLRNALFKEYVAEMEKEDSI